MPRYIDADSLCEGRVSNDPVVIAAKCELTADVAPVVHGHWIITDYEDGMMFAECSVCTMPFAYWKGNTRIGKMPYCPHCGAKMDEEVEK